MADTRLEDLTERAQPAGGDLVYVNEPSTNTDFKQNREDLQDRVFSQVTHGFSAGEWVYRLSAAAWALAQGDAPATRAEAMVKSVPDANTFTFTGGGYQTLAAHGKGADATDLWLSTSVAGADTTTKPTPSPGEILQKLGKIQDANTLNLRPDPYVEF